MWTLMVVVFPTSTHLMLVHLSTVVLYSNFAQQCEFHTVLNFYFISFRGVSVSFVLINKGTIIFGQTIYDACRDSSWWWPAPAKHIIWKHQQEDKMFSFKQRANTMQAGNR